MGFAQKHVKSDGSAVADCLFRFVNHLLVSVIGNGKEVGPGAVMPHWKD